MTDTPTLTSDDREFRFDRAHFEYLSNLARDQAGIELNETKRELVYGRVARRLRDLHLDTFDAYCDLLRPPDSPERPNFINCITTNFTSFFREGHHFEFLRDEALPRLMEHRADSGRLRIWSAACSTGQEPYSIAITAHEALARHQGWDCRILATDIDSDVVARADAGIYSEREIGDLGGGNRRGWFQPVPGDPEQRLRADPSLQSMIYFRSLNLMEPWRMRGPIDVIFCRNVVIYFSKETQRGLFERFARILAPDGYLFIGHSETILNATDIFEPIGGTIYRLRGRPT